MWGAGRVSCVFVSTVLDVDLPQKNNVSKDCIANHLLSERLGSPGCPNVETSGFRTSTIPSSPMMTVLDRLDNKWRIGHQQGFGHYQLNLI